MEDLKQSVRTCLSKFADFSGRADLSEFWWFAMAQFAVGFTLTAVAPLIGTILSLVLVVPTLAVGARRLHDIGKSGWLQLLVLIPLVGWLILVFFLVRAGDAIPNSYGDPR
jgi:uncharacterized membrane protein YhaH (DUF805 family)